MSALSASLLQQSRRKPLAACVAAIFALSAPEAIAATVNVTNCNDSGMGSLRAAVAAAGNGDTVDMSALPTLYSCSTITLRTGAITVNQNDLTLTGPATGTAVQITGKYMGVAESDRIFNHQGTGTLHAKYLTIAGGSPYSTTQDVQGGCIYSKGSVFLYHSHVVFCQANAQGHFANGGGIATLGTLQAESSTIANNAVGKKSGGTTLRGRRLRTGRLHRQIQHHQR